MNMMKKLLIASLLLIFAVVCYGQDTLTVSLNPTSVAPGGTSIVNITLSGSTAIAALQFTAPAAWSPTLTIGSAVTGADSTKKLVNGSAVSLIYGLSITAIPNSVVASGTMTVPFSASAGPQSVTLSNALGGTPAGIPATVTVVPATLTVLNSPFDVDHNGSVTSGDIGALAMMIAVGNCTVDPAGLGSCNLTNGAVQIMAEVIGWIKAGSQP